MFVVAIAAILAIAAADAPPQPFILRFGPGVISVSCPQWERTSDGDWITQHGARIIADSDLPWTTIRAGALVKFEGTDLWFALESACRAETDGGVSYTPDADEGVQCLLPGPWHVADWYLYPQAVPVEDDCFDIETDMDIYEAAISSEHHEGMRS